MGNRILVLIIPALAILGILAYFFVFTGKVIIESGTLDPATIQIGGKAYVSVTSAKATLTVGSHSITVTQADYQTLTTTVSPKLWQTTTVKLSPTLAPEGAKHHEVRAAAANFAETWGTYTYQNFDQYAANIATLATPQFTSTYFPADSVALRKAHIQASRFTSSAKVTTTQLRFYSDSSATVQVSIRTTTTSDGSTDTRNETQVIALVKVGSAWKVSGISGTQ